MRNKMSMALKERLAVVLGFLSLFALYAAFSTNAHLSFAQDALAYSHWVESGYITKINRHFLWNHLFFCCYKVWTFFGMGGGALKVGQLISALFGAGGVVVFYRLAREVSAKDEDIFECTVFSFFYAFSFAYWHFSGEANPQTFSNFLRLILALLIIRSSRKSSFRRSCIHGILFGFVLLSELMGFLLVFAYVAMVFFSSNSKRIKHVIVFGISSAAAFYFFYGVSSYCVLNVPLKDIPLSIFWMGPKHTNFGEYPLGILYLVLNIIFVPGLKSPSIGNREVIEIGNIFGILNTIFYLFLCYSVFVCIRIFRESLRNNKALVYGALLWFMVPLVLQIHREPRALDNLFYILFPVWILLLLGWQTYLRPMSIQVKKLVRILLMSILFIYAGHNFVFGIYPNSRDSGYEMYNFYQLITSHIKSDDEIVLVSKSGNYELYEIDHMLRFESGFGNSAILLDGSEDRAFLHRDRNRYDYFRSKLLALKDPGSLYMLIIPGADLELSGNVKKLVAYLKERLFDSHSGHAPYAIGIIEDIAGRSERYEILDNGGLDCTLIKLVP